MFEFPRRANIFNIFNYTLEADGKPIKTKMTRMKGTYKNKNVIFICDIRALDIRNAIKKEIKNQNNVVSQDMTWQQEWYNIIKPITALFKFRLPWLSGKTKYLDGTIFYQVWQGKHSTETRLIPNGLIKEYDIKQLNKNSSMDLISFVKDRLGHDYRYAIDISKIKNELDWKPKTSIGVGLQKTINWYLND